MKNLKIYMGATALIFTSVILLSGCSSSSKENLQSTMNSTLKAEQFIQSTDSNLNKIDSQIDESNKSIENSQNTVSNVEEISTPSKVVSESKDETIKSESDDKIEKVVIEEFKTLKNQIQKILDSDNVKDFKKECKNVFVAIVDFIFYDGEIKGITFDELSDASKQEILKLSTDIDELIMKKFPDYKENISSFTKDAYNKASELIKKGSNNIKDFAKEKLGEKNYNNIKKYKDDIKLAAGDVWEDTKKDVSNLYGKAKEKIKNWYENFKNK